MKEASLDVVGVDVAAEQELPSYQQIMASRHQHFDAYLNQVNALLIEPSQQKTDSYQSRYQQYKTYREGSV